MDAPKINCEKLAEGLEDGLDPTGQSNFRELYLRLPICGLVSTAVKIYLQERGISAETKISKPSLPFDRSMEHVVVVIRQDDPDNPHIVDATYGQFLKYTGYDIAYQNLTGKQVYPYERVIAFDADNRTEIVKGIAKVALDFRDIEPSILKEIGFLPDGKPGSDWIPEITTEQHLVESLEPIWNPANFHPYEPSEGTLAKGIMLSKFIGETAVEKY